MYPLIAELQIQIEGRERLAAHARTRDPRAPRSSLAIMRDIRRRREQNRSAA